MEMVIKEADESMYGLKVISEANILPKSTTNQLKDEANELVSIFVASVKKLK
jgi:four helix bundle protein